MTYMGHFFWVSPGQSSCSAWLSVHIWYNSASSPVRVHLLAKMDSSTETLESLTPPIMGWHPSLFSPQGTFLCMNSWKDLFDLKNEKYVVSLSFIWAGLRSSASAIIFILEYVSTGDRLQLLSLGPIYLVSQKEMKSNQVKWRQALYCTSSSSYEGLCIG